VRCDGHHEFALVAGAFHYDDVTGLDVDDRDRDDIIAQLRRHGVVD